MIQIIDEMSELIYISDLDTYELLYMNRTGRDTFHFHTFNGRKCYDVLQGLSSPCSFCTNCHLSEEKFYNWEITNPVTQRHYLLKDRIIDWNGKKARLEIAFDMTDKEKQQDILRNELEVGNMVAFCAKELCDFEDSDRAFNSTLKHIGTFLQADRAYIFQNKDGYMSNTYEWCKEGIQPEINNLQNIPLTVIKRWKTEFNKGNPIIISDLEKIKEDNYEEYEGLVVQNIHSLITYPLMLDGEWIGYVGVDNYSVPMLGSSVLLLTSIAYFMASAIYRKWAMNQLEFVGYNDVLTGLMNRNAYLRDLAKPIEGSLGILYMDVNGIKKINDNLGHQEGDRVLVDIAHTIKHNLPNGNAYRIGGDEFVVFVKDISKSSFEKSIIQLKEAFLEKEKYTVAVGHSWYTNSKDIHSLLIDADENMYADKKLFYSKNAFSNRYRHALDDILQLTQENRLETMIDEGNFVVFYQPKFDLDTNMIKGAEALARCQLSNGTIYSPEIFIPILEDSDKIALLDLHIFESVCKQLQIWKNEKFCVEKISINFSRKTLNMPSLVEQLDTICRKYEVSKNQIEIELTETVESDSFEWFVEAVDALHQSNYRIAIDDFGIKNANLSLLTEVKFDVLKIDKHVIHNIITNKRTEALLGVLIDVCLKMGVDCVAEGVETQEQVNLLKKIHCPMGQGYYFSKPISGSEFQKKFLQN